MLVPKTILSLNHQNHTNDLIGPFSLQPFGRMKGWEIPIPFHPYVERKRHQTDIYFKQLGTKITNLNERTVKSPWKLFHQ